MNPRSLSWKLPTKQSRFKKKQQTFIAYYQVLDIDHKPSLHVCQSLLPVEKLPFRLKVNILLGKRVDDPLTLTVGVTRHLIIHFSSLVYSSFVYMIFMELRRATMPCCVFTTCTWLVVCYTWVVQYILNVCSNHGTPPYKWSVHTKTKYNHNHL